MRPLFQHYFHMRRGKGTRTKCAPKRGCRLPVPGGNRCCAKWGGIESNGTPDQRPLALFPPSKRPHSYFMRFVSRNVSADLKGEDIPFPNPKMTLLYQQYISKRFVPFSAGAAPKVVDPCTTRETISHKKSK